MIDLPRISIVTPSFQQAEFLEETIQSVLNQGYPNLQYWIIDGGSTDDSVSIIKKYENRIDGWVSEPDRGQSHAINKGFARADGVILGWLNSDDVLADGALDAIAEAYQQAPHAIGWVGDADATDRDGNFLYRQDSVIGGKREIAKWGFDAVFFQPSCFFSRDAFQKAGGLREHLHYALDPDLWMRLCDFGKFERVDKVLSRPRIYPECKSHQGRLKLRAELVACSIESGFDDIAEFLVADIEERARQAGYDEAVNRTVASKVGRSLRFATQPARSIVKKLLAIAGLR